MDTQPSNTTTNDTAVPSVLTSALAPMQGAYQPIPETGSENHYKSAVRLAETKTMPREEWLEMRKQGIGASEAAAAVGLNPYQSPLELWMIKTGRDTHFPKDDPNDDTSPMFWGNVLEKIVAKHYSHKTGNKVRRVNAVLQHPDTDKPWMLANLDYAVSGNDDVQILECKTAGEWGAKLWKDGVPEYVQCQVQHQLAVTGKQAADVCVLICGQRVEIFRIERDEELIDRLITLERQFWRYVESDTPPPTDGSDSAGKALGYLYPHDKGETVDFTGDVELCEQFDALVSARDEIAYLSKHETKLKQEIQARMGGATKAAFINGTVSWKRSKDTEVLDTQSLLAEQPVLMELYAKTRKGSRRFTIQVTQ